jgi:hypothetical protein
VQVVGIVDGSSRRKDWKRSDLELKVKHFVFEALHIKDRLVIVHGSRREGRKNNRCIGPARLGSDQLHSGTSHRGDALWTFPAIAVVMKRGSWLRRSIEPMVHNTIVHPPGGAFIELSFLGFLFPFKLCLLQRQMMVLDGDRLGAAYHVVGRDAGLLLLSGVHRHGAGINECNDKSVSRASLVFCAFGLGVDANYELAMVVFLFEGDGVGNAVSTGSPTNFEAHSYCTCLTGSPTQVMVDVSQFARRHVTRQAVIPTAPPRPQGRGVLYVIMLRAIRSEKPKAIAHLKIKNVPSAVTFRH